VRGPHIARTETMTSSASGEKMLASEPKGMEIALRPVMLPSSGPKARRRVSRIRLLAHWFNFGAKLRNRPLQALDNLSADAKTASGDWLGIGLHSS